jgi:hypothetical protein
MAAPPTKPCAACGRTITWRKTWARDWDDVRYCSAACRRRRIRPVDGQLEAAIRSLLAERAAGATICPSDAARRVAGDVPPPRGQDERGDDDAWRPLMEPARRAARRLVAAGEVEITQRGRVVDPSTARGPIRIRRAR